MKRNKIGYSNNQFAKLIYYLMLSAGEFRPEAWGPVLEELQNMYILNSSKSHQLSNSIHHNHEIKF